MLASTNATKGILGVDALLRHVELDKRPADPGLEDVVENFWSLRWDLPAGVTHRSSLAPHPNANLSLERPPIRPAARTAEVVVTGAHHQRFDVDLHGTGWVYAAKFAVGALTAATGAPARALANTTVPAAAVVGDRLAQQWTGLGPDLDPRERQDEAERLLAPLAHRARSDTVFPVLRLLVESARDDETLVRVDDLAALGSVSVRQLQRLFSHYVGLTPKAVLRRYRMLDVVARIDGGEPIADLAARFGWYDQSHFTRDFTRLVGVPPAAYRAGMPLP